MDRYISMRQIAQQMGVNPSTVSRALKNDPSISEGMKERIRKMAGQMGFRPSPALGVLNEMRWLGRRRPENPTIAYLTWHHHDSHGVLGALRRALQSVGEGAGYQVIPFYFEDYPCPAAGLEVLYNRGVRGLILDGIDIGDEFNACDWSRFSVITTSFGNHIAPFHLVTTNPTTPLRQLWDIAARNGSQRIGVMVPGDLDLEFLLEFRAQLHVLQFGISSSSRVPLHIFQAGNPGYQLHWMRRYHPQTVIGFEDDIYDALLELGYAIPAEVRFASLRRADPDFSQRPANREIAGLTLNFRFFWQIAIELLDDLIRRNKRGISSAPIRVFVDREWVPGPSMPEAYGQGSGVDYGRSLSAANPPRSPILD